ncbi:CRAL-TRIO domain-containing protein [Paraphysoderma sedebokerense]|nr:CRAL-TRIO domain-containing protein [Paraphysoderma sedebokerense]
MAPPEAVTFGRLGHLTPQQETALNQLRTELVLENNFNPERHDDCTLLRFLRARRFDVGKSKTMLLNCETWRKEYKVDELVKTFTFPEAEAVGHLYPQYYHKTDKLGRPVYIENYTNLNIKELNNITTMERLQQKLIVEYELSLAYRYPACSKLAGRHIEQSCTILDLQGISLMSVGPVISFIREVSKIGQDYYPELLGTLFIINAPMLFSSVWSIIKAFLDEVTVKKIIILNSNYKSKVLEYIDEDHLPVIYGGNSKLPETKWQISDIGPWKTVPKEELDQERQERTKRLTELMEKIKYAMVGRTSNSEKMR